MKRNDMFFILLAIVSGFLLGHVPKAQAASPYTFTILDVPGSTHNTVAYGINNMDIIVGSYIDANGTHGFLYDGTTYSSLDMPGATSTTPLNINDYGIVVGAYTDASGNARGFSYDGSDYTSIDVPFPGVTLSQPWGINNNNEIVGRYFDGSGKHGFWSDGTNYTPIDVPFPGVTRTMASGTNDHGTVVGSYRDDNGGWGYVYDGVTYTTIGRYPGVTDTIPWDINDTGMMVGRHRFPDARNVGFLYDGTSFMTLEFPFPDVINSSYSDINNAGKIVGIYSDPSGQYSFLAEPDSPQEMVEDLSRTVISINLQHGISNSLNTKLESVIATLDDMNDNNDVAAINSLYAFINAVEAQRGKQIPSGDADTLVGVAQAIINKLETQ
jgi:hypothetical protein